jgi:hypothetical protein
MPRNGTQSDNVVDTSAGNQVHGVGEDSSVDRSGKVRLGCGYSVNWNVWTNVSLTGRPRSHP